MTVSTFPTFPGLTFPITRTPIWKNIRQPAISGLSPMFPQWSYPRWRYTLNFDVLRTHSGYTEFQSLVGFINSVTVAGGTFKYADPYDGSVTDQSFGTGDGSDTTFQLCRTLGGFTEPVYAPTGTPTIKVAGVTKATPADYSISDTGLVTFTAAPANGAALTWTGTFAWLCQFDNDETDLVQMDAYRWATEGLSFTTQKL